MEVTSPDCAGLDVHKKTVVACCLTMGSTGELGRELRTFGTMSADLLNLSDWLSSKGVTQVAIGLYRGILETCLQLVGR